MGHEHADPVSPESIDGDDRCHAGAVDRDDQGDHPHLSVVRCL